MYNRYNSDIRLWSVHCTVDDRGTLNLITCPSSYLLFMMRYIQFQIIIKFNLYIKL